MTMGEDQTVKLQNGAVLEPITTREIKNFSDRLQKGGKIGLRVGKKDEGEFVRNVDMLIVDKYQHTCLLEYQIPRGKIRLSPSYIQLMMMVGREYGKHGTDGNSKDKGNPVLVSGEHGEPHWGMQGSD